MKKQKSVIIEKNNYIVNVHSDVSPDPSLLEHHGLWTVMSEDNETRRSEITYSFTYAHVWHKVLESLKAQCTMFTKDLQVCLEHNKLLGESREDWDDFHICCKTLRLNGTAFLNFAWRRVTISTCTLISYERFVPSLDTILVSRFFFGPSQFSAPRKMLGAFGQGVGRNGTHMTKWREKNHTIV